MLIIDVYTAYTHLRTNIFEGKHFSVNGNILHILTLCGFTPGTHHPKTCTLG